MRMLCRNRNRNPRHLQAIEESRKGDYNLDKKYTKPIKLKNIIEDAREYEYKLSANIYANSLGFRPPNILNIKQNSKQKQD